MPSRFDDELWELAPEDAGPPPRHLSRFVERLGHSERALDLGCGDGRLAQSLDAASLTVADVSDVALERAARRLADATPVRLEPDAPLPLPDNGFDLVLCAETVEHVRDLQLLLSEARRVLEPGGRLALTTPAHSRLTGLDVLLLGPQRRFPPLSPHLRFLSRGSLRDLLEAMGFELESLRRTRGTLLALARR
jgi:SAM-dependent methyltransferase